MGALALALGEPLVGQGAKKGRRTKGERRMALSLGRKVLRPLRFLPPLRSVQVLRHMRYLLRWEARCCLALRSPSGVGLRRRRCTRYILLSWRGCLRWRYGHGGRCAGRACLEVLV